MLISFTTRLNGTPRRAVIRQRKKNAELKNCARTALCTY